MDRWWLRPDLKTSGGETHDIVYNDRYVGMMTLVYRENDRLTGAVLLEAEELDEREKDIVLNRVQRHVEQAAEALNAADCDVVVTYAPYERIIVKRDDDLDVDWVEDEGEFNDIDPNQREEIEMDLVVVHEERGRVEYHVYNEGQELAAEAIITVRGGEAYGTVQWVYEPANDDLDTVTELIVDDFEGHEIETFSLAMMVGDVCIDTVDLRRNDLLQEEDELEQTGNRDDYSVVLVRDDKDVLTYEIYQQSRGGLPIGTATVDISHRQLTGFIDFRETGGIDDRELIAMLLMEELDKEKDYDSFNVSMMVKNRLVDEILFESEKLH
jgi:hypothetical protein